MLQSDVTVDHIARAVEDAMGQVPVADMHTHLYPPTFGTPVASRSGRIDPDGLMLWGIDELVTYHYLVAEVYRVVPESRLSYEVFWKLSTAERANHIWKALFVDRSPISEACRGVLTVLESLGLDPNEKTLEHYRRYFLQQDPHEYIDRVMETAGVGSITMTNAVFDENERTRWLGDSDHLMDRRFSAVLRIDPILREYSSAAQRLRQWGYTVEPDMGGQTIDEVRRFLRDWLDRLRPIYMAVSLPPEWNYPTCAGDTETVTGEKMLEKAVLPVCRERGLPFAMMIGSRLGVAPGLKNAGDMVGRADVMAVCNLCRKYPENKFLVTMLSRENQHELCVAARKFGNLMIFGCWWFLNNPSLVDEITRMRLELLGTSFIPQHSDARVLEQLIYKWRHSRSIITTALTDKYRDILKIGRRLSQVQINRDVRMLLADNIKEFIVR